MPDSPLPKRRANDLEPSNPAAATSEYDPEALYAAFRNGVRSIESLAPLIPLNIAFLWHMQGRISQGEFAALMSGMDIHEIEIGDLTSRKTAESDAEHERALAIVSAFKARMATFDSLTSHDVITEADLKPVLLSKTPLVDGIGIRMSFAVPDEKGSTKNATPPALTLLCRAFIASTSMQSTLKCEAVFSAPEMEHDLYCRIVVPLPIYKGGRRRLMLAILDNETRRPVNLPPGIAEIFHEKNLFQLELMKKGSSASGVIGSVTKGIFGRLFGSK